MLPCCHIPIHSVHGKFFFFVGIIFFGVCRLLSSEVCDRMENRREMSLAHSSLDNSYTG